MAFPIQEEPPRLRIERVSIGDTDGDIVLVDNVRVGTVSFVKDAIAAWESSQAGNRRAEYSRCAASCVAEKMKERADHLRFLEHGVRRGWLTPDYARCTVGF